MTGVGLAIRYGRVVAAVVAIAVTTRLPAASAREDRPALSPAEALATFVVEPGYRIDLVAAEPLIQSPVAMAFDDRGRLFVVENRGYPDPLDGEPAREPEGVVALLTDTNADGRFDTRTDFAAGLTYPNGVMPWDGGVFVTMAPDLLYLKDTTGDGVADERRVVLTGFNANRTAQIRFSHPTLGPDGWIYFTAGLNGGRVTAPGDPGRPAVEFTSSDSRFNPRTGAFELAGGQGQFGLTFDDYGRRFICANRNPVWHVVLEPKQLARNPSLAFSETVHDVSTMGAEAVVWPVSPDLTTASFHPGLMSTPHAGTFTSASGLHIHRGDALPNGHQGSIFVAEPAQNLVQRQIREPDGVSFRSRPAREGAEFLSSRDTWFRPVFAANGPDGALYVVDMYRKDIDHPAYIPEASRPLFAFTAGKTRGRIYRLAATDRPPRRTIVDLADAPVDRLVAALGHPNAWWRDTAQRRLIERDARAAAPRLRALAADGTAVGRLHALWVMDALAVLEEADITRALRDPSAGVRENGLRIAERRMTGPGLIGAVLALADDADPRVRLHAALALGAAGDARGVSALASIARRDGADRWVRAAVLSGIRDHARAFLDAFNRAPTVPEVRAAVMKDLGRLFGAAESIDECLALVAAITEGGEQDWQIAALSGLAAGLQARDRGSETRSPLATLASIDTPQGLDARKRLASQMTRAAALAVDEAAPSDRRLPAIELLGYDEWPATGGTLRGLLEPRHPAVVQLAAVRALSRMRDPAAAASLVESARWHAYTPQLRDAVLSALLSEERHVLVLLDAISRGDVSATALGASRWRRLTSHRNGEIRERAGTLHSATDTARAIQAHERKREDVLARSGSAPAGAAVFAKHCAACHTFNAAGGRVGPDISGIRNQPADAILLHIAVPDYEITPGYEAYAVEMRNGTTLVGRLESEAPTSITLRDAAGQAHSILRSDVQSMAAAPSSLMPAGLDQAMSSQELADLIAYLKSAVPFAPASTR